MFTISPTFILPLTNSVTLRRAMGVEKRNKALLALMMMLVAWPGVSMAKLYFVGDSAGWTLVDHVDYGEWASDKNFHVGDVLIFRYSPERHNVLRVNYQDFASCNANSPIEKLTSGYDVIVLKNVGNFFFLCGFPGHCQAGQKVPITVT